MPASPHPRTVIASGLLCCALILVVLFTTPAAFRSPAALVTMGLIGTAAVLFQLRFRGDLRASIRRAPLCFNLLGILFAAAALFPAVLYVAPRLVETLALCSVSSFAISSAMILHSFRKQAAKPE
jgi:hypothetical protein